MSRVQTSSPALLKKSTGAGKVGATGGTTVQQELDFKGVTPFRFGADGTVTNDNAAIVSAITYLKTLNRGTLVIPSGIHKNAVVPVLNLSNSQSICVIDLRGDRISTPAAFGLVEYYLEGKDAGGGYATEFRLSGKQNPGFSMFPKSDGTAVGYPYPNNMTSIVGFNNAGDNNFQILTDPFGHGRKGDFAIEQYAQGAFNVSIALYGGVDLNNKSRFDFSPILLSSVAINISSITNTTPIVINTATAHGMVGQVGPISIVGSGVAALNGSSWIATNTGANQLTLLNSVASGVGGAAGTVNIQKNAQRAVVNVPTIQGGTEAICSEGQVVATGPNGQFVSEVPNGTAPILAYSKKVDINLHARPYILDSAGAQRVSGTIGSGCSKIVSGVAVMVAGTLTVTLTGDSVFTGATTYTVGGSNTSNSNAWKVTKTSGSSFTIAGTGTDQIDWIAVGY